MNERLKALLIKIRALAKRGVGGEKINAERMLAELMSKHNLTLDDIEKESREWRELKVPRYRLLNTLFWNVVTSTYDIKRYRKTRKRDVILLELTASEQMEIMAKYQFYSHHFNDDLDVFLRAFISKNELYSKTPNGEQPKEMTAKEYNQMMKALQMRDSMTKYHYDAKKIDNTKQIEHRDVTS